MNAKKEKRDSLSGKLIRPGRRYRTFYRGMPWECYGLVESTTRDDEMLADARAIGVLDRVPPIETIRED